MFELRWSVSVTRFPEKGKGLPLSPRPKSGYSLGLFREVGIPSLGVIENMSYLNCPHCGEQIEVFHRSGRRWLVEDEELEQLSLIPMDLAISRGIDAGHPLMQAVPDSPQAKAFLDIAVRILGKFTTSV